MLGRARLQTILAIAIPIIFGMLSQTVLLEKRGRAVYAYPLWR
jgi:hypothetical protein